MEPQKTTRTRIDPLTTVVDYDLLRIAYDLVALNQNFDYWRTVKVPRRPLGRVRFEVLRQFATFVLPVASYVLVALAFGWVDALWGLPGYVLLGVLLDRQLTSAIASQLAKEQDLDRGRYAATKIFCERLGLQPEEVNPVRLNKMLKDFLRAEAGRQQAADQQTQTEAAQAKADQEAAARRGFHQGCRRRSNTRDTGRDTGHGDSRYPVAPAPSFPQVNPANGLPMIGGTVIDGHSNPYGTNN